jgi:hypothetical protein
MGLKLYCVRTCRGNGVDIRMSSAKTAIMSLSDFSDNQATP